jgi:hypothetical protein
VFGFDLKHFLRLACNLAGVLGKNLKSLCSPTEPAGPMCITIGKIDGSVSAIPFPDLEEDFAFGIGASCSSWPSERAFC